MDCGVGRYGWIPPTYGITAEDASFDWCRDLPVTRSITELEILHGFLWPEERADGTQGPKPAYAFMYFRDPAFLKDVPKHLLPIFLDQDEENRVRRIARHWTVGLLDGSSIGQC